MTRDLDIRDFAERVERLCDFFLAKVKDDSNDKQVLMELKEEAADIHTSGVEYETASAVKGLDNFMRGIPEPGKETKT